MGRLRDALARTSEVINRLNVYPVPDGDTGTNMALTLEAVVAELERAGRLADASWPRVQGHRPTARSWGPGATRA